ncbi:hypothetical protein M409DRAFT_68043 [Zasmidium cellare ATCC 36951]|uniref:Uncharacterized protein n=1 Tax=Zasmidium cellare ATCC 36951 TaxID=1080233 RepID=A0A6A6CEP4_ZASCE|nr:uncharacterized protein M409DRAFT_68043 [Zasmidium cellare ATCC 36951]KAF2164129.1 hypothetical protein M409DRAFT_68043 [Zasmidium cellare ATCC 36951]
MYLDNRPTSIFKHTSGWNMFAPQPPGTLRRPPIVNAGGSSSSSLNSRERPPLSSGSSSSSLGGLEQQVPSFQSFIKLTPSVDSDQNKPLPPTPLAPKRSFDFPNNALDRRTSSVYSRTPSQFTPQTPPGKAQDPDADSPLLLRPIAYSASSPDLSTADLATTPFLEARTFSPLIESPRTTTVASSSPPQSRSQSMLTSLPGERPDSSTVPPRPMRPIDSQISPTLPKFSPLIARHGPGKSVHTVSLEKAKEAMHAPGAVRLLPEELRAQALTKVKSQGHMRLESIDILGGAEKTPLPPPLPTMVDRQGRERALRTPPEIPSRDFLFPSPSLPMTIAAYNSFPVGTGPVREMAPPLASSSTDSRITWWQLSQDETDEPRGRTVERRSYERNSRSSPNPLAKNALSQDGPQVLAQEYHSLLGQQQYRQASESPGCSSDESVRKHMKMVPQPLFQTKQPPPSRESGSSRGSNSSVSPFNIHERVRSDGSASSENRSTGFGLRLSVETNEMKSRHSSTTGMIPISPPTDIDMKRPKPAHIDTDRWHPNPRIKKNHSRENSRESSFYPHIMRRKSSKKQDNTEPLPPIPGKPLLAAEVIALKLKTPESTPDTSPMSPIIATATASRKPSSAGGVSSEKEHKTFFQRFGPAKSRRRSSTLSSSTNKPSPISPHLFPSPVKPSPTTTTTTTTHLGWSDTSKRTFDEARSPTSLHSSRVTYIPTPQRPRLGLEPESHSARGTGLFGSVLEGWREGKRERRREDLKRLIRVVSKHPSRLLDRTDLRLKDTIRRNTHIQPPSKMVNSALATGSAAILFGMERIRKDASTADFTLQSSSSSKTHKVHKLTSIPTSRATLRSEPNARYFELIRLSSSY